MLLLLFIMPFALCPKTEEKSTFGNLQSSIDVNFPTLSTLRLTHAAQRESIDACDKHSKNRVKVLQTMTTRIKQAITFKRHDYTVMSPVCLSAGNVV